MGYMRLCDPTSGTGSGTASGLQSEHSAFRIYLKDSRIQPSELFIPDGSADTLTTRTGSKFSLLKNGHEASLVRIETFIPYFEKDMYIIDHHNGDVYLWDQETNDLEPLALQATATPLAVDAVKMLTQTAANVRQLALQNRSLSHGSLRCSRSSRASPRGPSLNSHYGTLAGTPWVNLEDLTLVPTLHNISINPSSMDGPADGAIFESNHLAKIADIRSKLICNLVKVSETYCRVCVQLLNPSPDELANFVLNHERDFDRCLDHVHHLDNLLARDARHCIQLRYPMINYQQYVPTTVELCREAFSDILDKFTANLSYFKDDFRNSGMFESIPKPRPGLGSSMPNFVSIPTGGLEKTTPLGQPPAGSIPRPTPIPTLRNTPVPMPRSSPVPPPVGTPVPHLRPVPLPRRAKGQKPKPIPWPQPQAA